MKVRKEGAIKDNLRKIRNPVINKTTKNDTGWVTYGASTKPRNVKINKSRSATASEKRTTRSREKIPSQDLGEFITYELDRLKKNIPIKGRDGEPSMMQIISDEAIEKYLNSVKGVLLSLNMQTGIRVRAAKHLFKTLIEHQQLWNKEQIKTCVRVCIIDASTLIRDFMIDIVGFSILIKPETMNEYYKVLSERMLDKNVSVRKRVIKILGDFCFSHRSNNKVAEIFCRIIKRIKDPEESIRDSIINVFQRCWVSTDEEFGIINTTLTVVEAVSLLEKEEKIDYFDDLLNKLTNSSFENIKEEHHKITRCLIDYFSQFNNDESGRLKAILTTLNCFLQTDEIYNDENVEKIKPLLTLEQTKSNDILVQKFDIIKTVLAHLKTDPKYLSSLEKETATIILYKEKNVIDKGMWLLHELIKTTKNTELIDQAMAYCYAYATALRDEVDKYIPPDQFAVFEFQCKRTLYIFGTLIKYFTPKIEYNKILILLLQFLNNDSHELQLYSLQALGSISLRYVDVCLNEHIRKIYHGVLKSKKQELKLQILKNMEMILIHEGEFEEASPTGRELSFIDEGTSTSVILEYFQNVIESYFTTKLDIRIVVARIVFLIVDQGVVHFSQIIPHLICMTIDKNTTISRKAYDKLIEIEGKYCMMVYPTAVNGVRLSYRYLKLFKNEPVSGYSNYEAVHSPLFTIMRRNKKQLRAFMLNLLHKFEEDNVSQDYLKFYAENVAYFPYGTQDEVLFVLYTINAMIAVSGYEDVKSFIEENKPSTCLVLLALSKHLQEQYRFSDELIMNYSPWCNTKSYDKSLNKIERTLESSNTEELREYAKQWQEIWEPCSEEIIKATSKPQPQPKNKKTEPKVLRKSVRISMRNNESDARMKKV